MSYKKENQYHTKRLSSLEYCFRTGHSMYYAVLKFIWLKKAKDNWDQITCLPNGNKPNDYGKGNGNNSTLKKL